MGDSKTTLELQNLLDEIRHHLRKAQGLMDSINPDSAFGAHVQQLLDELDEHAFRDLSGSTQGYRS